MTDMAGRIQPTQTDPGGTKLGLAGLEPDNLLALLALLGLLRALEIARPEWRPRAAWSGTPPTAALHLAALVTAEEIVRTIDNGIRHLGNAYFFDRPDITYSAEEFRQLCESGRDDPVRAQLVAALASDAVLKRGSEAVEATTLCAMFGQGHQHFLSRLVAAATRADTTTAAELSRALFESWRYEDETEGLRWDPIEDRRYAHQYGDPSEGRNKIGTVTGANRLAAIGFSSLTSAPTASGLMTVGIVGRRGARDVCWPLVEVPTSLAGHFALLAHPALGSEQEAIALKSYGVGAVGRARRYLSGKFFNFERARVQML